MIYLAIGVTLLLSSCSLSSSQEVALNTAKTSYINSKNNGTVMSYVAFTLPEVVAFYKNQSDSIFQERFDLSSDEYSDFLTNGNIREIVKNSPEIHVKYEFTNVNVEDVASSKVIVFALSKNDGITWFFAEKNDYFNDEILSPEKRLIKE
ncbi:MAG: hypothetical protein COA33_005555 [Fluviicola sp.]|nr:hypothetical protein [Fluviicola sp.]